MSETDNNRNTEFNPDDQYNNTPQVYDNGQYYNPNPNGNDGGQYYGQNTDYNYGQQYYNPQTDYNNGQQYYNPQADYNNGQQYYNPQTGYNNGQQYYNPQTGYNNGQQYYGYQPYANPQTAYQQAQPVRQPVNNVFYYILMALTAVSAILTIAATISMIRTAIDGSLFASLDPGQSYASIYDLLMNAFANSPTFSIYPTLNYMFRMAILFVAIADIVQVHKKEYPILGMILFTIFFKPGYFIWRAYAAKQPKLIPVLFTVFYVLLYVGYFFWCFLYIVSLV